MFKLRLLNVWYTRDHGQYKIVPKWEEEERENDFLTIKYRYPTNYYNFGPNNTFSYRVFQVIIMD
jgi:hypothetical protein